MTKTIVLGASGLLGQPLAQHLKAEGHDVLGIARSNSDHSLDLVDQTALVEFLSRHQPELIINCAAMVDLAECEHEPGRSWAINAEAVATLGQWSQQSGARLIQISTDQFFNYGGRAPHSETDLVQLVNRYARQKFAGEAFAATAPNSVVIRTNLVGFRNWSRPTFGEWVVQEIRSQTQLTLFDDVFFSAISAKQLALYVAMLAASKERGIFNIGSSEVFSKKEFIVAVSKGMGIPLNRPLTGTGASLVPRRAGQTGLDVTKFQNSFKVKLPDLSEVVDSFLKGAVN